MSTDPTALEHVESGCTERAYRQKTEARPRFYSFVLLTQLRLVPCSNT